MDGKKILLIEDDPDICTLVHLAFRLAGAQVVCAEDGEEGVRKYRQVGPDLILLDVMMPRVDGWEALHRLRQLGETPIIMVSAAGDDDTIVRALDLGAVDFVTKPVSPKVLLARARAALRRLHGASQKSPSVYSDDYLTVDLIRQQVFVKGKPVRLTRTEYRLFSYLAEHPGQLLSFDQILDSVWGKNYGSDYACIHVYISRLRQKLEQNPAHPRYFISEYGIGYRFLPPGAV